MAWQCSGRSNEELVQNLWTNGIITESRVKDAFLQVDRAHYAPAAPYEDSPQPIGHGATISAPHMHASAVEQLLPSVVPSAARPAPRVLDIGSGSGYLVHVLAELVGPRGVVIGVEHIASLQDLGAANMAKSAQGRAFLSSGRARFRLGDGRRGWSEQAAAAHGESAEYVEREAISGWDAIHVGASAKEIHPQLLEQLRTPGRMFIPVNDDEAGWSQHVWLVEKDAQGVVTRKKLFGVRYVPLTDAPR